MKNTTNRYFATFFIFVLSLAVFFLAGCSSQKSVGPVSGIENYLKALVEKDSVRLVNAACASWEENARLELRTFDAVEITLENLACTEKDQAGDFSLISCDGKIVANYGNEILEINLSERTYQAIEEGGEWRMCGYH